MSKIALLSGSVTVSVFYIFAVCMTLRVPSPTTSGTTAETNTANSNSTIGTSSKLHPTYLPDKALYYWLAGQLLMFGFGYIAYWADVLYNAAREKAAYEKLGQNTIQVKKSMNLYYYLEFR